MYEIYSQSCLLIAKYKPRNTLAIFFTIIIIFISSSFCSHLWWLAVRVIGLGSWDGLWFGVFSWWVLRPVLYELLGFFSGLGLFVWTLKDKLGNKNGAIINNGFVYSFCLWYSLWLMLPICNPLCNLLFNVCVWLHYCKI